MFSLEFTTDNAAFDDGVATETCRILREVARNIERGELEGMVRDVNGNTVGQFTLNGRNPRRKG
jgi:hypothetical protein